MLSKHPQHPRPGLDSILPPLPSSPTSFTITSSVVQQAIASFPNGTGPGPSGFRASHLKEAIICPSPVVRLALLNSITSFVNFLCQGVIPSEITPHLCGALLLATKKKSGGLRPIAVGEVLRRLVSKCVARSVRLSAVNYLSPLQLGVGIPNGAEALVHAIRNVLLDDSIPSDKKYVLQLDLSNAFNNVSRLCMFDSIRKHLPLISGWMELCYRSSPYLHFGENIILSQCGVQQGDPLGPLGFSMALHPILQEIRDKVPGLIVNSWYLDDGVLCGSIDDLLSALHIVESNGPPCGLHLNRAKSLLFHSSSEAPPTGLDFPLDVPVAHDSFTLLGAPIGPPSFCNQFVLDNVQKIFEFAPLLPSLHDSQMAITLLRSCWSFSRMSYLLRTIPPSFILEASSMFDSRLREVFEDVIGCPVPSWSWLKATLPCSMGGLNL